MNFTSQTEWIKALKGKNVVIHVGGSYGEKKKAIERFKTNLRYVDQNLITIENDDKIFNANDTLKLAKYLNIPMVLDYHHHIWTRNKQFWFRV